MKEVSLVRLKAALSVWSLRVGKHSPVQGFSLAFLLHAEHLDFFIQVIGPHLVLRPRYPNLRGFVPFVG